MRDLQKERKKENRSRICTTKGDHQKKLKSKSFFFFFFFCLGPTSRLRGSQTQSLRNASTISHHALILFSLLFLSLSAPSPSFEERCASTQRLLCRTSTDFALHPSVVHTHTHISAFLRRYVLPMNAFRVIMAATLRSTGRKDRPAP